MATKPTEQPEVWASASVYTSGPKVGQPTKASTEAGLAVEGHKPGPTEPTTANEFNVFENKVSLLARWTFEGRFDKAADAHIVETDSTGLLSARAADFGDLTQPGPSLTVSKSSSDWTARFTAADSDGVRIQGSYGATQGGQLAYITSSQDNIAQQHALHVQCTDSASCGGILIEAAAQGTISGEDLLAACTIANDGGTGLQVRTENSVLPAMRVLNRENGGTSARFGYGVLESTDKNLDGAGIDCRGGDADSGSIEVAGGPGIITRGGASDDSSKMAGHGILALSGTTSGEAPGGAAVWAQTVGPAGIAIEASHNSSGATLPVIQATTGSNNADAIEAVCTDAGNALDVFAESGSGIRVTMDPAGGGGLGYAINLQVQQDPTVTATAGKMWVAQGGSKIDLRVGLGTSTKGYAIVGTNCPCYARSQHVTGFILSGAQVDQAITGNFGWVLDQDPASDDDVIVTIWGQVSLDDNSDTNCILKVRDTTEVGNPVVCQIAVATPDHGVAGLSIHAATTSKPYKLPNSGARTFDLVWEGDAGLASGSFTGWVEIKQAQGSEPPA